MGDSTARAARIGDRMALAAVVAAVVILLSWAAVDASYANSLFRTPIFLRLPVGFWVSDTWLAEDIGILEHLRPVSWNPIGIRVLGMSSVFVIGGAASLWIVIRALVRHDIRSGFALGLVLAAWGMFLGIHRRVDDWKVERQVRSLLPRIEAIGSEVDANWPKAPVVLKSGGSYFVDPEQWPRVLLKRGPHDSDPFQEDLGRLIYRTREGALQFDLAACHDRMVEFHPHGTVPKECRGITERHRAPARSWVRLKENWYLVRY
ncbi:hypothetical protein VT03_16565 [Planctomyces sp. SH-PL14]|nr:hypothetical protein VT03_16565 [Planctomyces sp. SH-PL14]